MVKPVRVLTDAEFTVLRKWACVRCEHCGYCSHCDKLMCSLDFVLCEVVEADSESWFSARSLESVEVNATAR